MRRREFIATLAVAAFLPAAARAANGRAAVIDIPPTLVAHADEVIG